MASKTSAMKFVFLLISSFAIVKMATAGDPDILFDFIALQMSQLMGISSHLLACVRLLEQALLQPFMVLKATLAEFPALNGQSVSIAVLEFPAGIPNPPHTHPRSAELLFLVDGTLQVGFVDTTNKLFTQTLQTGDMFVFPKGLVDAKAPALAISTFGSANAGLVSIPNTLFNSTSIDNNVLALSFKTDVGTIQHLKAGLAPKS